MRFFYFYDDLINEGRYFSEDKYNFIVNNLGDLLFNKLITSPKLLRSIPDIDKFESYLKLNTTNKITSDEDVIYNINEIGEWLKNFPNDVFSEIVNNIFSVFPDIKKSVDSFNKPKRDPSLPPTRRGRPPGVKSKPKPIQFSRELSRRPIEPEISQEPSSEVSQTSEPVIKRTEKPTLYLGPEDTLRKKGRKPIDDGLTSMERMKYKNEGPEMINKLENKISQMDKDIDNTIQRIKKIMNDIEKRKKYFGIE